MVSRWVGGQLVRWAVAKILPVLYHRKLGSSYSIGTLIGGVGVQRQCVHDLTFNHAIVTLTFIVLYRLYLDNFKGVGSQYMVGTLVWRCRCDIMV